MAITLRRKTHSAGIDLVYPIALQAFSGMTEIDSILGRKVWLRPGRASLSLPARPALVSDCEKVIDEQTSSVGSRPWHRHCGHGGRPGNACRAISTNKKPTDSSGVGPCLERCPADQPSAALFRCPARFSVYAKRVQCFRLRRGRKTILWLRFICGLRLCGDVLLAPLQLTATPPRQNLQRP